MINDILNPYLVYIKIAAFIIAVGSVIAIGWYIRYTFSEKERLTVQNGALTQQVVLEQQKVAVAMEQIAKWQEMVDKMTKAVKNIKVEANTYVTNTENSQKPVIPDGGSIPFVLSGMSADTTLPSFANISSGRNSTAPAAR